MTRLSRSVADRNALAEQWSSLPGRVLKDLLRSPTLAPRLMAIGLEDLGQVGQMALLRAADAWDERQGYQYSTLAYRCIRNAILNEAKRCTHRHLFFCPLAGFTDPPSPYERDDGNSPSTDVAALHAALAELPALERELIDAHFGIDAPARSYKELGETHGRSGERVRQVISRALSWLARRLREGPSSPPSWIPDPPFPTTASGAPLWTVRQAADTLGVPTTELRRMRRRGELPPGAVIRVGDRTIRIHSEVFKAWIAEGCPSYCRPRRVRRRARCAV